MLAFSQPASTVRPSTPAVLRPALISVTRRTLTSALLRERSNAGRPNHAGTFQCTWLSSGYAATAVRVPAWMAW